MNILTEKGVLVNLSGEKLTLKDLLGNVCSSDISDDLISDLMKKYCISPVFLLADSSFDEAEKEIRNENTSLILDIGPEPLTFLHWADQSLTKVRHIEWATSQLIYGRTYSPKEILNWLDFNRQDIRVRDCHCDSLEYEKFISHWNKELPALTKSFQALHEITRLFEIVRFELSHAEARLREAIWWITEVIKDVYRSDNLEIGSEYVKYGMKVDQVGWCITDMVKALSTALDALSKYISIVTNAEPDKAPKTPAVMAGHINNYKPKGSLVSTVISENMQKAFSEVKSLINLRHELTHNQALYPVRQTAFVGYATPCVRGEKITYGEIIWWDKDGDHFKRSSGRIGFFSERRNAIIEAMIAFKSTYKLVDIILEAVKLEVFSSAKRHGISSVAILTMDAGGRASFATSTLDDLIN